MVSFVKKVINFFNKKKTIQWKNIENFDPNWKERIKDMSRYIDSGSVIVDLGCGEMWLKEFITEKESYIPVDYMSRGGDTIVCDFNNYEYPKTNSDTAFVSGCLEYIEDFKWFVEKISQSNTKCILSYCTTEYFPNMESRKQLAWKNNLSKFEVISLFESNQLFLVDENLTKTNNQIFVFKK
ncbi:class I SAM-dependent methyltransferase [Flavobacterium psychrotolerans]|nr:hypothetical protein [Flavobacterium psychrotolerans]